MLDPVEQEARVPPRQETMNTSRHSQWEAEAPGRGIAPRVDQELAARVGTLGKRLGRPRLLREATPTPAWRFTLHHSSFTIHHSSVIIHRESFSEWERVGGEVDWAKAI